MAFFDSALWQTDDAAAEEARRRATAPPVIAGLTPDGVNPVVSSGYREGVSPKYGVPEQLMGPAPVPPDDASRHPAVVKMLSLPRLRTAPTPDAVMGFVSEAGDREGVTPGYGLPTPTAEYLGAGVPIPGGPPVIAGPTLGEVAGSRVGTMLSSDMRQT